MKFTVPSREFGNALAVTSKVTERRNTIPVLSNVVIDANTDKIMITATDLDVEISMQIAAGVIEPGSTTVPAHLLQDISKKMSGDITFQLDGQMATVSAGRSKFKLQTLPVEDFPTMNAGDYTNHFSLSGNEVEALFGRVSFAQSSEETRYYLNGTYFHAHEENGRSVLRGVATDGHRLARSEIAMVDGAEDIPSIIIPKKTITQIGNLANDAGDSPMSFSVSTTKIRIESGDTVLVSKLIDASYPDYIRVIPKGNNNVAFADAKVLSDAANRVSTISSEKSRGVKFSLSAGGVSLTANSAENGSAEDYVELDYDSEPIEIGFSSRYFSDICSAIGSGKMRIELQDAGSPTLFKVDGDDSLELVLMPLRI